MDGRCSVCGEPLDENAVAFTAGELHLFRPCAKCADKVRGVARGAAELVGTKLTAKLSEFIPPEIASAMKKAVKIGRALVEED